MGAGRRGELYSAVAVDSEGGNLEFRCRQKVWFGERTHMKVFGLFTNDKEPRLRAQVGTKRILGGARDMKISGRIRYDAAPPGKQVEGGMVKARLYAKKSFDLGRSTAVNLKAEVVCKQEGLAFLSYLNFPTDKIQTRSRVEFSKKLLDVTDTQDVRLRCGVELESGMAYAEVRENHLQLRLNSKGAWSMLYDI